MVRLLLIRLFTLLFFLMGCFCPAFQGWAEVPQEKVVRLGYSVPDRFLDHPEDMDKSGYTYDYLQMIADYSRWRYEYVYGSWSDMLKMLENGDIDVLANVSYTPERGEVYSFSDFPLRIETYYVFVPTEKVSLYTGLDDFRGRKVAVGKNTTLARRIREFNDARGLGLQIVEYGSFGARMDALNRGDVDGTVEFTSREEIDDALSPLFFVGNDTSFIAVTKGREDLLHDLNRSLAEIHVYNPTFAASLRQKYFQHDKDAALLTLDDRNWFKNHGPVRMGYMAHMVPFIWTGPDGKAVGTFRDLLDYGFQAFRISNEIQYIPYESMDEMRKDLAAGTIDGAMPVYDRPSEKEQEGLLQTANIVSVKMYKISRKEEPITDDTVFAVADSFPAQEKYVKDFYPRNRILHYTKPEDVFQALRHDEADVGIVNPYLISIYLANDKSLKQEELPHKEELTVAVNRDRYPLFMALNRMNNLWGDTSINDSLLKHADELYQPGFMDYVERNYGKVIVAIFLSTLVLTLLVSMIIFRGRQKKEADVLARMDLLTGLPNRRAYEEKLKEIEGTPPPCLVAVVLDVNGLKLANDTRGHRAGDELIRAVGDCFRKTLGEPKYRNLTCLGYRVGGDEFVGLLYMDDKTYVSFAETFQRNVSLWKGQRNDCLSVSLGHAGWNEFPNAPVTELLRLADNRMYEDKKRYYREKGGR